MNANCGKSAQYKTGKGNNIGDNVIYIDKKEECLSVFVLTMATKIYRTYRSGNSDENIRKQVQNPPKHKHLIF